MPERGFYGMGRSNRFIFSTAVVLDGGGSLLPTGDKAPKLHFYFPCLIEAITLEADLSGSVVIDILKTTYAAYQGGFVSICGAAKPTLSGALKGQDFVLAGWSRALLPNDVLKFNVNSATTLTSVTLTFKLSR